MNKKKAIINGNLFMENEFKKGDILINDDRIEEVLLSGSRNNDYEGYEIIDAENGYTSYGFIDPHVHFRCPGNEHKEDWHTGSRAAINGGFTFVIDMPNNKPAATNAEILRLKNNLAKATGINYGFYIGLTDSNCDDIDKTVISLVNEGIPVYGIKVFLGSSTGDLLVQNNISIDKSLRTGLINLFHCEDEITLEKFKNIEYVSVLDHHKHRPPVAEVNGVKRIIEAAGLCKDSAKIYICHVSSKELFDEIIDYKDQGFDIISEITPHHLYFNLENIDDSQIFKVNPPIRPAVDAVYLQHKFDEGLFDVIGTDHAPHLMSEKKSVPAPSGMPGLETCFYALYDMYKRNIISLEKIFELLTSGYKIFGIQDRGKIEKNSFADITIIKNKPNVIRSDLTETKADFTPYEGLKTDCMVDAVLINGNIRKIDGKMIN